MSLPIIVVTGDLWASTRLSTRPAPGDIAALAVATAAVSDEIRRYVPAVDADREVMPQIHSVRDRQASLLAAAESVIGALR